MAIKAVIFDAYGTLLRNEGLMLIPHRIVADHGLSVRVDDVWRVWSELYFEATQVPPFRTLREIEGQILPRVLREFAVSADAAPYVEMFFQVTTKVELYPETLGVLNALKPVPSAIVSNADHEHVAAWNFTLPVQFILVSETVRAYKPHQRVFQMALDQPRCRTLRAGQRCGEPGGARGHPRLPAPPRRARLCRFHPIFPQPARSWVLSGQVDSDMWRGLGCAEQAAGLPHACSPREES